MKKTITVKKGGWLESEIDIDAKITLAAMDGGMDGVMNFGFQNRDLFPTTDDLMKRVYNLKKMPESYITAVSERVSEIEKV